MSFAVGQKIVCINDDWVLPLGGIPSDALVPQKDQVYVCAGYWGAIREYVFVFLEEDRSRSGYLESHFRPLTERKTDITIFEQLLTPAKPKQLVDV